jgi:hypothetical protein
MRCADAATGPSLFNLIDLTPSLDDEVVVALHRERSFLRLAVARLGRILRPSGKASPERSLQLVRRGGQSPELLQQAHGVHLVPALDDLPVLEAPEG